METPHHPAETGELMSDDAFVDAFESCTLPFAAWTHRMHVRYAFIALAQAPRAEAMTRVRRGIQRFNAKYDRPGYHETMTEAWVRLVDHARSHAEPAQSGLAFLAAHPHLQHSSLVRLFYTKERLFSPEAKAGFLPPDLRPLE
jgi:hypothetical protein